MAKSNLKILIARSFAVLKTLWEHTDADKQISYSELTAFLKAQDIDLDKRTLWTIIDSAQEFGLHVKRPHGNSSNKEGYRFDSRPFEDWEIGFLCDSVSCTRSLTDKEKSSLKSKLIHFVPKYRRISLMRDFATGNQSSVYKGELSEKLSSLSIALNERRKIQFIYWQYNQVGQLEERNSSSHVKVDPFYLIYRDEAYYLLAQKETENGFASRTYRLDRMSNIEITEELAGSPTQLNFNINKVFNESFGMFLGNEPKDITISFKPEAAKYIVERFGLDSLSSPEINKGKATITVRPSPPFYAWIFQFDGLLTIEGPTECVEEYKAMLNKALDA